MNEAHNEAIARRIRGLLAKTTENGATEAEALAAAEKAGALMAAHRLTQSDVEIEAEPIDEAIVERENAIKMAAVDYTLQPIEKYCGVKIWYSTTRKADGKKSKPIHILGLKADVEMARYLYSMLATTISVETGRYSRTIPHYSTGETRRMTQSFQVGMALRIAERIKVLAAEQAPVAKTSTGTSLVVVKNAVVDAAMAAKNMRLSKGTARMSARHSGSYAAGRAAGDRVNLSRPVGGTSQARID